MQSQRADQESDSDSGSVEFVRETPPTHAKIAQKVKQEPKVATAATPLPLSAKRALRATKSDASASEVQRAKKKKNDKKVSNEQTDQKAKAKAKPKAKGKAKGKQGLDFLIWFCHGLSQNEGPPIIPNLQ